MFSFSDADEIDEIDFADPDLSSEEDILPLGN